MDADTLLLLLKGNHLSMPERVNRGAWPHAPLVLDEITGYLARVLENGERWFPRPWERHKSGEVVREGGVVERQAYNRYVYRTQASDPESPTTLHSFVEKEFLNARDAAAHYLKWDLQLPGDLDGWKVVK